MAFSMGNGGGGGGGLGRSRFRGIGGGAMAEINIVPLVDVVLVLLIIFMLTAHVMEFGLEVEVPKVNTSKESVEELPMVTISKDGELYLADKPVNINAIGDAVKQKYPNAKGVYLRADKGTVWDPIAQVINALGNAKMEVKVVTQPEDSADRPRRR